MHSLTSHLALHFPPLLIIVNYAQQHNCKDEAHWKKSGVSFPWDPRRTSPERQDFT